MKNYAIRFEFPEGGPPIYAGKHKGALGWAPQIETALLFDSAEKAGAMLANGYGNSFLEIGKIVEVLPNGETVEVEA